MLSYLMPLDARVLLIRYAWVSAVQVLIILLHGGGIAAGLQSLYPSLGWLAANVTGPLQVVPILLTEGWGTSYLASWVVNVLQLALLLGLIRFGAWKLVPDLMRGIPLVGVPEHLTTGELVGRRLRRPAWALPVLMTFSTILTAYVIAGGVNYLFRLGGGRFGVAYGSWGEAMNNVGPWPAYVALGLSALGIAWGFNNLKHARAYLSQGFGVGYLPDNHWVTQRVHRLAARIDLPPPSVGITRQANAFACGPSPQQAAVIIGVPLVKTFTPDELDAVIGHELGHVVSGDMREMQFAEGFQSMFGNVFGVVTGLVGSLAASQVRDRSTALAVQNSSGALNVLGRYVIAFAGELMVKGLSRNREYHADAVGAALSSPEAMTSALEKIHKVADKPTDVESAYGYLMFRGGSFGRLFSTHPTMAQRKAALERGTYLRLLPRKPPPDHRN